MVEEVEALMFEPGLNVVRLMAIGEKEPDFFARLETEPFQSNIKCASGGEVKIAVDPLEPAAVGRSFDGELDLAISAFEAGVPEKGR